MKLVTRLGWAAYAVAAGILILDQLTKYWVLYVFDLSAKGTAPVLGPVHFSMVWNRGVSFGLFQADLDVMRWALTVFSLVVAAVLVVWARTVERVLVAVALGLIIGGAVGNAIDRIRFGAVTDFIDFSRLYFPWVFNVADSAITIGVVLLLWDSLRREPAS